MSVDPETMEELLASEAQERALRPLRSGETVEGTVAAISGDHATIDLVVATVADPEGRDGRVVLSLRRSRGRGQWERLEELARSGEIIEADVIDANRGGVVVDVGLRGFVPLSQLGSIGAIAVADARVPDAVRALVGKRLRLRVIEADLKRDRLILSEKSATRHARRVRKAEGVATLAEGQILEGTVASVTTYGVFVDVGVADGLVHRTEITWDKAWSPRRS